MSFRKFVRIHFFSRGKALSSFYEIRKYMSSTKEPRINVGCGKNLLKGWLNVDLFPQVGAVRLDASHRWPFADDTFSACLCEHMIEHVPKPVAQAMISEMFRTLRSDGVLRIVTPDLATFARITLDESWPDGAKYVSGIEKFLGRTPVSRCDVVNEVFYSHGHKYIYTIAELSKMLYDAGFRHLQETRGGLYLNSIFNGVDGHINEVGQQINEIEAFAIEARK